MSAVTITLASTCAGGGHLTFAITGDKTATVPANFSELADPISDEDAVIFCKVIARMVKKGRTVAQARALLQAGVTVTV